MENNVSRSYVAPWTRVAVLIVFLIAAGFVAHEVTGSLVPRKSSDALIFQSGLLLLVLGSAILEHKFNKPADSVVNALTALISLVTVYSVAPLTWWWLIALYCAFVFVLAALCTVVSTGPDTTGWKRRVADWTYDPAVFLGRSRIIHSLVFLFAVFSFYETGSRETAILVVFWGIFVALWPLKIPQLLSRMQRTRSSLPSLGRVIRREWPGLIRVELRPGVEWTEKTPRLYQDADGIQHLVVPLYKQLRDQQGVATGLNVPYPHDRVPNLSGGFVYELPADKKVGAAEINSALGADPTSTLIGFVIEESHIGAVRFETWRSDVCREGLLVWCEVDGKRVNYQITQGLTREEALESDRLGSQYAVAAQMGTLDTVEGFEKADWLPTMNSPVFTESKTFGSEIAVPKDDFVYGRVPGTGLRVSGPFAKSLDFHTAILGVTGSGKTELAFDLIREAVAHGTKVVCIDLTARYEGRLEDLTPRDLSISDEQSEELANKLFDAETGPYGGGAEKQVLEEFHSALRTQTSATVEEFLTSTEDDARVGLITLDEISNTQATLVITELYMTGLLNYARDHSESCPKILVVVEEAHTVMPETSTMGVSDFGSKGLVSKISQIALQGRKYGVGLLVIAQRTATVSKNVLTQCNTFIALSSFDETSVNFLSNVFGRPHAETLRDLPRLHAVIFGKGIRSQRPVIVEIPFDEEKAKASNKPSASPAVTNGAESISDAASGPSEGAE